MAVAIMATTIAGAKKNSGVIGVEVVLFVEFGLGDILTVGVDEAAVVADGGLVGAWVTMMRAMEMRRAGVGLGCCWRVCGRHNWRACR